MNINFFSAEKCIEWLEKDKEGNNPNKLHQQEEIAIKTLAASFHLQTTEEFVHKEKKIVPFLLISNTKGEKLFTVRKMNGNYIANQTHPAQNLVTTNDFNVLWQKLGEAFKDLSPDTQSATGGANGLDHNEIAQIEQLADAYQLTSGVKHLDFGGEKAAYVVIGNIKTGEQRLFSIRRVNGNYKLISYPNNTAHTIYSGDWNGLIAEVSIAFNHYVGNKTIPSGNPNILSVGEQIVIEKLALNNMLKADASTPGTTAVPYVTISGNMGSAIWEVRKYSQKYEIHNVIGGQHELIASVNSFAELLLKLTELFKGLSGNKSPDKLTADERKSIGELIAKFSPAVQYSISNADPNDIIVWVGGNITSYKLSKVNNVYRLYGDINEAWVIVQQYSTFKDFMTNLGLFFEGIINALKKSKLGKLKLGVTAQAEDPDLLSSSEVDVLKDLLHQFNITVGVSYSKKYLQEAAGPKKDAFAVKFSYDTSMLMVSKKNGQYVLSKVQGNDYVPIKEFNHFAMLLQYLDFYLNSESSKTADDATQGIVKIPDDKFSEIKDLVKNYQPQAKVRRKHMVFSGKKYPYVSIEGDYVGFDNWSVATTADGKWKLFKTVKTMETWEKVGATDSWESMYDLIAKALQGEISGNPENEAEKPVLSQEQFEWLQTFLNTHAQGAVLKKFGSGIVGAYDSTKKVFGEDNPLFVIRKSHKDPQGLTLQVHTKDGGVEFEEYPFASFDVLADFITTHLDVATQLLSPAMGAVESVLPSLMEDKGFSFKNAQIVDTDKGIKNANIYENDKGERIYIFNDGSSLVWTKEISTGKNIKHVFDNLPDLVKFLQNPDADEWTDNKDWSTGDGQLDDLISNAGFKYHGSEEDGQVLVFFTNEGFKLKFHIEDASSMVYFPQEASTQHQTTLGFESTYELAVYLANVIAQGGKMQKEKENPHKFAKHYYDDLGDQQMAYSIRLTQENEAEMKGLGWTWMHAGETFVPSAYYKPNGYRIIFYNKSIAANKNEPTARIISPENKVTMEFKSSEFPTPYEVVEYLKHKTNVVPNPHVSNSTMKEGNNSILKYNAETQNLMAIDLKLAGFPKGAIKEMSFQYNQKKDGTGEIRVVGEQLFFAVGKMQINPTNVVWYVRQKVYDSQGGMYRQYTFLEKKNMLDWIKKHANNLISFKSIKDDAGYNAGNLLQATPDVPPPPPPSQGSPLPDILGSPYYPEDEVVQLLKGKGFQSEIKPNGTEWVHPSGFSFMLYENGIHWHYEKGSVEFGVPKDQQFDFLNKALKNATPETDDAGLNEYFTDASKSRQDKLYDKMIDMAIKAGGETINDPEFETEMENKGFAWFTEEKCWTNDDLIQVVVYKQGTNGLFKVWWLSNGKIMVSNHSTKAQLYAFIGPDGKYAQENEMEKKEKTGSKYVPSGETYAKHHNEANADMIWLNPHDEEILQSVGFVRVPQENRYYKNSKGDIIKFFDTGKSEFIENGQEVVEFDNIPHALKFLVTKYHVGPFSQQNYATETNDDNIEEIQLNGHDEAVLNQLGFKWDENGKKYIKFLGPNDKPKIYPHYKTKPGGGGETKE